MPNPYTFVNWGLLGDDKGGMIPLNLDSPPEEVGDVGKEITYQFFNMVYQRNKKVFDDMLTHIDRENMPWRERKAAYRRPLGWLPLFIYANTPNEVQELRSMRNTAAWRRIDANIGYGGEGAKWFKANMISPLICEVWNNDVPVWAKVLISFHLQYKVAWLKYGGRWLQRGFPVLRDMEISVLHNTPITPNTTDAKILTEHFIHWLRRNNPNTCGMCKGEGSTEPNDVRFERLWSTKSAYGVSPIPAEYICGRCNGSGQVY